MVLRPEDTASDRPLVHNRWVAVAFLIIGILYVVPLFVPDPSLRWASEDEICCHIPTIRAVQEEGLMAAVQDYTHYRSATTPLYHVLMSFVLGRVDPVLIRMTWSLVTLAVGFLLYHHVRTDPALGRGASRAGLALATAYLLSPTIRASAVYFVTDGLAAHLAVAAMVLLRYARTGPRLSPGLGVSALIVAYASFYTRQYYLWATLYVAYSLFMDAPDTRTRVAATAGCVLLALPAIGLFSVWRGFTPQLGWPIHTHPALLETVPNLLGLLAVYCLPLAWIGVSDSAGDLRDDIGRRPWLPLTLAGGLALYVAIGLALGFEIPEAGGILRLLNIFGSFGAIVFLMVSCVGLMMLVRWAVVDGVRQLWWMVFLLPLLVGTILLQRYFEPAVMVFMFLVARPRDALKVLDSRLVWYYPLFTAAYALSRTLYFKL